MIKNLLVLFNYKTAKVVVDGITGMDILILVWWDIMGKGGPN